MSKEEAIQALKKMIRDAWKDMNEASMRPTAAPMPILVLLLNCGRTMEFMYKHRDAYTYSDCVKDDISSLLMDKIPVQDES